ncbi:hypothetical protein ACEPAH_7792 [Sanghuangporus vaninii]
MSPRWVCSLVLQIPLEDLKTSLRKQKGQKRDHERNCLNVTSCHYHEISGVGNPLTSRSRFRQPREIKEHEMDAEVARFEQTVLDFADAYNMARSAESSTAVFSMNSRLCQIIARGLARQGYPPVLARSVPRTGPRSPSTPTRCADRTSPRASTTCLQEGQDTSVLADFLRTLEGTRGLHAYGQAGCAGRRGSLDGRPVDANPPRCARDDRIHPRTMTANPISTYNKDTSLNKITV